MNIFIAVIALSFLILVHEFGHFIAAKLSGIKVEEFSLFMGPKLFGIQRGETMYSVRLVPLGGYVKMEGEEEASDDERAFNKKPIPVRMAVIFAGPLMNLLIAVIFVAIVFSASGFSTTEISSVAPDSPAYAAGIRNGDTIVSYNGKRIYHPSDYVLFSYTQNNEPVKIGIKRDKEIIEVMVTPEVIPAKTSYILGFTPKESEGPESNVVASVLSGTDAEKAGLKAGDRIVGLNDVEITSRQDIADFMAKNNDAPVQVTVERGGQKLTLVIKPALQTTKETISIGINRFKYARGNLLENIKQSVIYNYSTARSVYYSFLYLIQRKVPANEMMGPIGIVTTIGETVEMSQTIKDKLVNLVGITSLISVNLGIMNLIPFPALDGSKIIILIIEVIRRKAMPPEKEAIISMVGLVLLLVLMVFATSNDIMRIFGAG
ncbi:RIP metalloprotease RseP [Clostridium thermosuccinogenes]|uniref:Zinc metalloprotease n=1 Tax=Clostridium thermosuccinogenes TaxID=84032 RepID=A0A2K2FQQ4_9CLOT|nr:RIP metalloprotease RseP [Pseudoclostridium thermosuccinogenes]PNU01094.1 RIP metalloprotease RseP [Pseudoclostridium thermosuccinogenes]